MQNLYDFYGELSGVRIARKHIGWYIKNLEGSELFRKNVNQVDDCSTQLALVNQYFNLQQSPLAA